MNEQPATTEDLKELFGDGFKDEYQQEAQERWGETRRVEAVGRPGRSATRRPTGPRSRPRWTPSTRPSSRPSSRASQPRARWRWMPPSGTVGTSTTASTSSTTISTGAWPTCTSRTRGSRRRTRTSRRALLHTCMMRSTPTPTVTTAPAARAGARRRPEPNRSVDAAGEATCPAVALSHASRCIRCNGSGRWGHACPSRGARLPAHAGAVLRFRALSRHDAALQGRGGPRRGLRHG